MLLLLCRIAFRSVHFCWGDGLMDKLEYYVLLEDYSHANIAEFISSFFNCSQHISINGKGHSTSSLSNALLNAISSPDSSYYFEQRDVSEPKMFYLFINSDSSAVFGVLSILSPEYWFGMFATRLGAKFGIVEQESPPPSSASSFKLLACKSDYAIRMCHGKIYKS